MWLVPLLTSFPECSCSCFVTSESSVYMPFFRHIAAKRCVDVYMCRLDVVSKRMLDCQLRFAPTGLSRRSKSVSSQSWARQRQTSWSSILIAWTKKLMLPWVHSSILWCEPHEFDSTQLNAHLEYVPAMIRSELNKRLSRIFRSRSVTTL